MERQNVTKWRKNNRKGGVTAQCAGYEEDRELPIIMYTCVWFMATVFYAAIFHPTERQS